MRTSSRSAQGRVGSADGQLSQAELPCAVATSSPFLSLLEQGRTDIAIGRLLHLAGFYDAELTDLAVATLEGHSGGGSVAFSADELLLASAAVDGTVRRWDIRKRARSPSLESGWLFWRWPGAPAASRLEPHPGASFSSVSSSAERHPTHSKPGLEILRSITRARAPRPVDSSARSDASLVVCRFPSRYRSGLIPGPPPSGELAPRSATSDRRSACSRSSGPATTAKTLGFACGSWHLLDRRDRIGSQNQSRASDQISALPCRASFSVQAPTRVATASCSQPRTRRCRALCPDGTEARPARRAPIRAIDIASLGSAAGYH
jgi:hypothetical protein